MAGITQLSPGATPTRRYGTFGFAPSTGSRPDHAAYTHLGLTGTSRRPYGDFTRAAQTDLLKPVSDTYLVVVTFGPVSDVDIDVDDAYRPVLTMNATAYLTRAVSDTYRPVATMGVAAIAKGGSTAKAGTDTYTPVLTLASSVVYEVVVSDTYTPVVTLSADALNKADAIDVSDTYTPALDLVSLLNAVVAQVDYARSDSYVPVLGMSATVNAAGDVDVIDVRSRPYWIIEIDVR